MIGRWLTRLRHVDILSAEVAALRERVAELETQTRVETERARAAETVTALASRIAAIHEALVETRRGDAADLNALAALADRVAANEEQASVWAAEVERTIAGETASIASRILALERQLRLQERHSAEIATALAGRIDRIDRDAR